MEYRTLAESLGLGHSTVGVIVLESCEPIVQHLVTSMIGFHRVLYCIVLNYYTGTPLSPEDYFPGSPVKVEQQTYTHTTHNTVKSVSKSVNQSVSSVDGRGVPLRQPLYCFHFALVVWLHVTEI